MGKTNEYNIQEDESLATREKKYKRTFLFSLLKNSPSRNF